MLLMINQFLPKKYFFGLAIIILFMNGNISAKKVDNAQLQFGFFRAKRNQIGGNAKLILKTSFTYLQPWTGERFAPDEPSSFSYANYVFADNHPYIDFCIGVFRNHSKGDILVDNYSLHFEKGNSQVGLLGGVSAHSKQWHKFSVSATILVGIGPQVSKLSGYNLVIIPDTWGIRGLGEIVNVAGSIKAPIIKKRWQLSLTVNALFHAVQFGKFDVLDNWQNTTYTNKYYFSNAISPSLQVSYLLR
jgi:hypothetical protein